MKEQELNTYRYIMDERNDPLFFYVTKYWKGEFASGGPMIAIFYDKQAAEEYCYLMNHRLQIKNGK